MTLLPCAYFPVSPFTMPEDLFGTATRQVARWVGLGNADDHLVVTRPTVTVLRALLLPRLPMYQNCRLLQLLFQLVAHRLDTAHVIEPQQ
jgi:hypothetical protein